MEAEISSIKARELFEEIEPGLRGIARRYGVVDPAGEARSWYARFIDILDAFNSGRLSREIHLPDGSVEVITGPSTSLQNEGFIKSLKPYLKKSFKNDLIKSFNREKIYQKVQDLDATKQPLHNHVIATEEQVIKLSDLLSIIESDCKRKSKSLNTARDYINHLFLKAIHEFHSNMFSEYGDIPIVRDLKAQDSRDFFIFDIREGRTESIGKILAESIEEIQIRSVQLVSRKLLSKEKGYFTLNRKISRYFNDALGGMPNRLKRLKLGSRDENGDFDI